jgi:AcrR family transcriptional regulator
MLREKRLRPGPGTPPEDVARNQRRRLYGAMVASVAERGYAATRLSDLVELSGVSRKSFYALFADKEACFVGAIEAMLGGALDSVTGRGGSWGEQLRSGAAAFADLVVSQPAAARMCLIEAYVVGPKGLRPVEETTAGFEARALTVALEAGMQGEALPAMISAQIGALMEITRERLRLGREDELPGLAGEFADVVLSYEPPPQPLRLTTRPPTPAPETLDAHGHMERVLRAFAAVTAERGYANTTIDLVLKRAAMSPTTFYANFASKEDMLYAAIDSAGAQLLAAVLPSFRRNPMWTHGVRGALGDFFNFLASRPALARLLMVEVYGAGPKALERREATLRSLTVLLAEGRAQADAPPIAIEVIGGSIYRLAYKQIRESGTESLPTLAPICTYITLAPLIGAEEACAVANGDGRGRGPDLREHDRQLLSRVGLILNTRKASAEMIAREIGVPADRVREQIDHLVGAGLIVALEEETDTGDGSTETFYHIVSDIVEDDRWEAMSLPERQVVSKQVAELVKAEFDQAIELGTFDARVDRHLSRMPLLLDERGWRDLFTAHYKAFQASLVIQAEAAERLESSGERSIPGSSIQALFEVPRQYRG